MGTSTERIERLIKEVESKPSVDSEQLIKQKMAKAVKFMKVTSNIYMVLTFIMFIMVYVYVIQNDYFMVIFSAVFFVYTLYNLFNSYFFIKVYTSKNMVFHGGKDGQTTNETIQQPK